MTFMSTYPLINFYLMIPKHKVILMLLKKVCVNHYLYFKLSVSLQDRILKLKSKCRKDFFYSNNHLVSDRKANLLVWEASLCHRPLSGSSSSRCLNEYPDDSEPSRSPGCRPRIE